MTLIYFVRIKSAVFELVTNAKNTEIKNVNVDYLCAIGIKQIYEPTTKNTIIRHI